MDFEDFLHHLAILILVTASILFLVLGGLYVDATTGEGSTYDVKEIVNYSDNKIIPSMTVSVILENGEEKTFLKDKIKIFHNQDFNKIEIIDYLILDDEVTLYIKD